MTPVQHRWKPNVIYATLVVCIAVLVVELIRYHNVEPDYVTVGSIVNRYQLVARATSLISTSTQSQCSVSTVNYTPLNTLYPSISELEVALCDIEAAQVDTYIDHTSDTDSTYHSTDSHASHGTYRLLNQFSGGAFGEIYFARRTDDTEYSHKYVVKRLRANRLLPNQYHIYASGLREIHFGQLLTNQSHIVQFVEQFQYRNELYLVFQYAGITLYDYLYSLSADNRRIPSINWYRFKQQHQSTQHTAPLVPVDQSKQHIPYTATLCTDCIDTTHGATSAELPQHRLGSHDKIQSSDPIKSIIYQLLRALHTIHSHGVTHRDIKLQNVLLSHQQHREYTPDALPAHEHHIPYIDLTVCDFGSAIDNITLQSSILYPMLNYTLELQSTQQFAPPETIFSNLQYDMVHPYSYDIWSFGILIIELICGTSEIYHIDDRTRALIDNRLSDASITVRNHAYILRAMIDMCIYTTAISQQSNNQSGSSTSLLLTECGDKEFGEYVRTLDITGIGFTDTRLLQLTRRMLQWNSEARISAADALQHSYFDDVRNNE